MTKKYSLEEMLAFAGGVLGLAAGLVIGLRRFGVFLFTANPVSEPQPPSGDSLIGQLAFVLVFVLPFVLGLLAFRSERTQVRAVIWIGSGLLALVGAIFSFSITLLLLPVPGVMLLAAGAIAFLKPEVVKSLPVIVLALGLVALGAAAFTTLFSQEDPACWAQIRTESGENVWEPRPADLSAPIVLDDPDAGDVLAWSCSSDVLNPREGAYSIATWVVGLALGAFLLGRKGFIE